MLSFAIALSLSAFLLFPANSAAQETCFTDDVAGRMVVALEQARIIEQQVAVSQGGNAELQQQVEILKGTVQLLEDQVRIYRNMAAMQEQMATVKDRLCDEEVKAARPTLMHQVGTHGVAFGLGAILAGLVVLLL
jgi:hypothetical protein